MLIAHLVPHFRCGFQGLLVGYNASAVRTNIMQEGISKSPKPSTFCKALLGYFCEGLQVIATPRMQFPFAIPLLFERFQSLRNRVPIQIKSED